MLVVAALVTAVSSEVRAQQAPLQLGDLQQAAVAHDPRTGELALLESQSSLRLRNLAVQWLPSASVESQAQFQSDAPTAPLLTPSGQPVFAAPKQNYDVNASLNQRLFDPTVSARAAVERAQLAENQARVRAAVYAVRQEVNDAFFAAATLQQRVAVLTATLAELQGRLDEANARVREGTALPADAAAIEATLLQRQQDEDELRANIRAALARLATIVGRAIPPDATLALPDLTTQSDAARQRTGGERGRPEYEQFARTRERLERQADLASAQAEPTLSAFGRAGYGKPGLDFIQNEWEPYASGGVKLQWNAWNWGSTGRERQVQSLQAQIVAADEAAFTQSLSAATESDQATIDHLVKALATDARIIDLRAQVESTARARLQEGVLTASDYLARNTELLQARTAQASHQVELAQARARLLTTLGIEVH